MTGRLRIAIATAGRFHVLDLARELHSLGHEVRFYSIVPSARARRFGLPSECHVSLLPFALPCLMWERLACRLAPHLRERLMYEALDRAVMLHLEPCDVFICMSGIYLAAARFAKQRFGAQVWIERGSRHILSQDEILARLPGANRPTPLSIKRELSGYALADRIVIPSTHVEESFGRDSALPTKLFRNPYGVDLAMFPQRPDGRSANQLTFLYAGVWSLQKGCKVLAAAICKTPGVQLIHVGAIGDFPFPTHSRFRHIDAVPQHKLAPQYAKADAFVLASVQDGFGAVLAQALASGLPVICTDRTGGLDLAHTPALAARIKVVPNGDTDALAAGVADVRDRLQGEGYPTLSESDLEALSWAAYGRRYSTELMSALARG